jgi:hypothetical protein
MRRCDTVRKLYEDSEQGMNRIVMLRRSVRTCLATSTAKNISRYAILSLCPFYNLIFLGRLASQCGILRQNSSI